MIASDVLHTIGNTPAMRLTRVAPRGGASIVVKLEMFNPTGSYKDRMALAMIEGAERRGALKPGMRVVEYTGGSTGSSLAMVCAVKGYRFTPLSSDAWAREKLQTMRAFGADLQVIHSPSGRITPDLFVTLREEAERQAREPDVFYTNQFHNDDALDGYAGIGRELLRQTGGAITTFCAAVGTAGMLAGVARALEDGQCDARIVALEPASSPWLTRGVNGPHRVDGIGVGFTPPHLARDGVRVYDEAMAIDEEEARDMTRRLARDEGLLVGTSTGLNVAAAVRLASALDSGDTVATVAVDTGLKYLAGDLFSA